jgi:hypothetical protein
VKLNVVPYEIDVPDSVLLDLRSRLRASRWPDPAPGPSWSQGTDLDYLRDLVDYWVEKFDWRVSPSHGQACTDSHSWLAQHVSRDASPR